MLISNHVLGLHTYPWQFCPKLRCNSCRHSCSQVTTESKEYQTRSNDKSRDMYLFSPKIGIKLATRFEKRLHRKCVHSRCPTCTVCYTWPYTLSLSTTDHFFLPNPLKIPALWCASTWRMVKLTQDRVQEPDFWVVLSLSYKGQKTLFEWVKMNTQYFYSGVRWNCTTYAQFFLFARANLGKHIMYKVHVFFGKRISTSHFFEPWQLFIFKR